MKRASSIKKVLIVFLIIISFVSCKETINNYGGIPDYAIYKTKGDYFHFYDAYYSDGVIPAALHHPCDEDAMFIEGQDTAYYFRLRLDSNYILAGIISSYSQFTDIRFDEYCEEYEKVESTSLSIIDFIDSRIIDSDPFIEYYEVHWRFVDDFFHKIDSSQNRGRQGRYETLKLAGDSVNEMIGLGILGENFKQIK